MDTQWISFDWTSLGQNFWSLTFDGLTFGAIYALVALGYTLVYGVLNLINFAHSEVFIAAAYACVFTLTGLGCGPSPLSMPLIQLIGCLLVACLAPMAASAAIAFLLERLAYKPLRARHGSRLAVLIT